MRMKKTSKKLKEEFNKKENNGISIDLNETKDDMDKNFEKF